jgi:glucosamine-6-phosphate deaminase
MQSLNDSFEKIPVTIFKNVYEGSAFVARTIANAILEKQKDGKPIVLGLATGSTPKSFYSELVKIYKKEKMSFKNVITFNLDEYYPIDNDAIQSYHRFMRYHLFDQVDILPENRNMPNGEWLKENLKDNCREYERKIESYGGIDIQILGIGQNGHIGFNEPGSSLQSKTRLIALTNHTRIANSSEFQGISDVPRLAITMGIRTIFKSKKIFLLAWGQIKAAIIKEAVEGDDTETVPASLLQNHDDVTFIIDQEAANDLTRFKSPWLTGDCIWDPKLIKRAVVNLALKIGKPVLNLTNKDYNDNGLSDLLAEKGDAYEINLQVYYLLRDSITGWPGGKNAELPNHPERKTPFPKISLIFSPHPDDDIISMGGTFQRLHDQGHQVHVAYQTSGNIAVTDEFVTRFLDFAVGFEDMFGIDNKTSLTILDSARNFIKNKKSSDIDTPEIRAIKGLIRRCEARATCRYIGLTEAQIHFQNLPFYETGTVEKKPMSENDIDQTMALLNRIQPNQLFCAGDLADPHGTHKVCLDIIFESMRRLKVAKVSWIDNCRVWLYKGAWQEWDISEIEMAIPMSPDQVIKKRFGIFIHQSQKDMVPFQGTDAREFWQRAEERNKNTADNYAKLGLTHYAAMEAFVRWRF